MRFKLLTFCIWLQINILLISGNKYLEKLNELRAKYLSEKNRRSLDARSKISLGNSKKSQILAKNQNGKTANFKRQLVLYPEQFGFHHHRHHYPVFHDDGDYSDYHGDYHEDHHGYIGGGGTQYIEGEPEEYNHVHHIVVGHHHVSE